MRVDEAIYLLAGYGANINPNNPVAEAVKMGIEALEGLQSVQPETIRCGECKYWRDDHTCREHSLVSPMMANEYCSRAERKEEED